MRSLGLLVLLAACSPTPLVHTEAALKPVSREPTLVHASFERTWEAVIDQFAEQNLKPKVMDKASGWISTDPLLVTNPYRWADCGMLMQEVDTTYKQSNGTMKVDTVESHVPAETAEYDVVVHGDSVTSTVHVSVRFMSSYRPVPTDPELPVQCISTGAWENEFETAIKQRAESPPRNVAR